MGTWFYVLSVTSAPIMCTSTILLQILSSATHSYHRNCATQKAHVLETRIPCSGDMNHVQVTWNHVSGTYSVFRQIYKPCLTNACVLSRSGGKAMNMISPRTYILFCAQRNMSWGLACVFHEHENCSQNVECCVAIVCLNSTLRARLIQ